MTQTRRLIYVDEQDEVIGSITPEERTPNHIYRVSALWLTNAAGEILIAQRHPAMSNGGGLWGPAVAGTVEVGETYEDNIRKETAEELGLTGLSFRLGPKVFFDGRPTDHSYFCQWFYAATTRPAGDFKLEPDEVAAVRWIAPAQLRQEIMGHPGHFVPAASRWIGRFI